MNASAQSSFPVSAKVTAGIINGTHTDVAVLGFANLVVVVVAQLASIGSIMHAVQASAAASIQCSMYDAQSTVEQLTISSDIPVELKFVLGSSSATTASSLYQALATHIFQHRREKDPLDVRPLILGIGLDLPREYKLPPSDDDAVQPDSSAFRVMMCNVAALVDECFA
ncbi:hypothetical protein GGI20_000565 [Coemansia sp. BCRC 34301]|nr:hypothetical protein GGI20_000565 [Coemansia sp. BCRC 34301]